MTCLADRQSFGKLLISKKCAMLYTINVKNMHLHRDSNPGPWVLFKLF